jgi:hypothetical protein
MFQNTLVNINELRLGIVWELKPRTIRSYVMQVGNAGTFLVRTNQPAMNRHSVKIRISMNISDFDQLEHNGEVGSVFWRPKRRSHVHLFPN